MGIYMCGDIYGIYMRGGESERGPPCGCAVYMWLCGIVCVVAGERESERERERGEGGGGEREKQPFVKTTQDDTTLASKK